MNVENTPIIARADGSFVVQHNGAPYHVVSKDLDPFNAFDIDEVRAFANKYPEEVENEKIPSPRIAEIAALKAELAALDVVVNRAQEDIIAEFRNQGIEPYVKTAQVIAQKNSLREQIKTLERI